MWMHCKPMPSPSSTALIALPGAQKAAGGQIGGTATVGDVRVDTGDWIVADADGVTVIPRADLHAVTDGQARADKEAAIFSRLKEGATTVEDSSAWTSRA